MPPPPPTPPPDSISLSPLPPRRLDFPPLGDEAGNQVGSGRLRRTAPRRRSAQRRAHRRAPFRRPHAKTGRGFFLSPRPPACARRAPARTSREMRTLLCIVRARGGRGGGGGSNARGGRRQRAKTSRPARRRTREVISTMRCGFLRMHCEMVSQTGGPAGPVVTFPSRHERGQRPPLIFLFSWRRRLPHSDCNRPGARAGPLEGERLSPCMVHPVVVLSPPVLRWVGRVARWQPGSW